MRIAGLLLAAGAGRRFGGCKQLFQIDGKPLVRHSLETLACVVDDPPHIVLGANRDKIRPVVKDIARVIEHPGWQQGMGSSIARGVEEIMVREQYDGILITLADQIRVTAAELRRLIEHFQGDRIVAAYYADSPGVPAIFPATLFERLIQLDADTGAKSILLEMQHNSVTVPISSAAVDIDVFDDVSLLSETYRR